MIRNFDDRAQKATDVTSTFIEVLIGLSSAIIAVVLAFYPNIASIENINFFFLKISLLLFGISAGSGILAFSALIGVIDWKIKAPSPAYNEGVRFFVFLQLGSFGIALAGLLYLIIELPTPSIQVAHFFVEDAVEALKNNNTSVALAHLTLADNRLSVTGENSTLKVFVENAIQALKNNDTNKALKFLIFTR